MDSSQYQDLFKSEAIEILDSLNKLLIQLEKNPSAIDILNEIFRMAHTVKGMAATMNYAEIVKLSHEMESVLDALRKDPSRVDREICAVLFKAFDALSGLIDHVGSPDPSPALETVKIDHLVSQLNTITATVSNAQKPQSDPFAERRMVRINDEDKMTIAKAAQEGVVTYTTKVVLNKDCAMVEARSFVILKALKDAGQILNEAYVFNQIKNAQFGKSFVVFFMTKNNIEDIKKEIESIQDVEFIDFELMPAGQSMDTAATQTSAAKDKGNPVVTDQNISPSAQNIRVSVQQLDSIVNLVGELVINKMQLEAITKSSANADLADRLAVTHRLLSELQTEVLNVRLIPMSTICDHFPRMVRDLAKNAEKQVNLEISGAEIGLDRVILDEIKDPLVHILRNGVDHGIELPAIRQQKGKNPSGLIKILVRKERGLVVIEIADDGNGMDIQRIKTKAVSLGLITNEEALRLTDSEAVMLITAPGLSTAEKVTSISGRGVGMDIVKKKVELFGGSFLIETRPSMGSKFIIRLPVSMTILKGLMVKVGHQIYAIPVANILKIVYGDRESIKTIDNKEVLVDRDQNIPLICLRDKFGFKNDDLFSEKTPSQNIPVVIVNVNNRIAGLMVDGLVNQQDMIVKALDKNLSKVKGISGATILGSGKVALIIDVPALI